MPERPKGHDWKSCIPLITGSWVRLPLSPPDYAKASSGRPSYLADGAPKERSRPLKLRMASQKICEVNLTFNLLEV